MKAAQRVRAELYLRRGPAIRKSVAGTPESEVLCRTELRRPFWLPRQDRLCKLPCPMQLLFRSEFQRVVFVLLRSFGESPLKLRHVGSGRVATITRAHRAFPNTNLVQETVASDAQSLQQG